MIDQSTIDSFQEFVDHKKVKLNNDEDKFLGGDEHTLHFTIKNSNYDLYFSFKERRSHTESYHNSINRFTLSTDKEPFKNTSLNSININVKSGVFHKIKTLIFKGYRNSITDQIVFKPNKKYVRDTLLEELYFRTYLLKYSFVKLTINTSEKKLTIRAKNLDTIPLPFLEDSYQFAINLLQEDKIN